MTAERLEADRASAQVGAGELARRFIDALNAGDRDGVRAIVTDDVEFRNPNGGEALSGERGVRALVLAVADAGLQLVPEEDERVEGGRVEVPVRVTLGGGDEFRGTALFETRDGRIAAFEVVSELVDR
jgi:ketosteroid isomerase-like protein